MRSLQEKVTQESTKKNNLRKKLLALEDKHSNEINHSKKLSQKISQLKNNITGLNTKIKDNLETNKNLNNQLEQQRKQLAMSSNDKSKLTQKVVGLNSKIDQLKNTINKVSQDFNNEKKVNSGLKQKITNLNQKINNKDNSAHKLDIKMATLSDQINNMKGTIDGLNNELNKSRDEKKYLSQKMNQTLNQFESTLNENKNLKNKLSSTDQRLRDAYAKLSDLKEKNANKPIHLNTIKKIAQLKEKINLLESQNLESKKSANRAQRKIASVQNSFRENLGKKIADRLARANIDVFVDPRTGNVILRMDDQFLFQRNSSKLSHVAKNTLKKVIPLYVEELFQDKKIASKIHHINIVGHASPRFRQRFVNPNGKNQKAYNYNLDLSSDRARSIVKYIFSRSFGSFKHRLDFRNKVQAIGKSFSQPVARTPASKGDAIKNCGQYDCKLSRRVEISFTLKDSKDAWSETPR